MPVMLVPESIAHVANTNKKPKTGQFNGHFTWTATYLHSKMFLRRFYVPILGDNWLASVPIHQNDKMAQK